MFRCLAISALVIVSSVASNSLRAFQTDLPSYGYSGGRWQTRLIPVCWETDGFEMEKNWTKKAITDSWQRESALTFTGWTRCETNDVGIRIQIADVNPHTKGLGSQLNAVPNGMVLNFEFMEWSPDCQGPGREQCIKGIAVHEFGHALSFAHEQNRPDTPSWCREEPQGTSGDVIFTPWDLESVMNYCNPHYTNGGVLSQSDTKGLRDWYGEPEWRPTADQDKVLRAALSNSVEELAKHLTDETINGQDSNGHTPLMLAVDKCNIEAAMFLISSGADVNVRNIFLDTALSISKGTPSTLRKQGKIRPRCPAMADILVRAGAKR